MTDRRIAQAPALNSPLDALAASIERELARLRRRRPALDSRIDRAANILVTHLSCPRQHVIRVRVRDGRPRLLVNGSGGAVYVVDPSDWSCSCPDFHRRGKGCKHSLACYALTRAARPAPKPLPCAGCGARFDRHELVEVQEDDQAFTTWQPGERLCRSCVVAHGGISS